MFDIPRATYVKLSVYNVKGELISTLVDQHMAEGRKKVTWTATGEYGNAVASGIYVISFRGRRFRSDEEDGAASLVRLSFEYIGLFKKWDS